MRENERLEEIFDRYVGLELLNWDWTETARLPGSGMDYARAVAEEFTPQFWGEPLPQGVVGST